MSVPVGYYKSYYCDYYTYCSNYCCSDYGYCTYASYCTKNTTIDPIDIYDCYYYSNCTSTGGGGKGPLLITDLVGTIVGALVGAMTLAALIFFLCWFFKRRTRLTKFRNNDIPMNVSNYNGLPRNHEITMHHMT